MDIIIVGSGKMGTELVRLLSLEQHNVTVIDNDSKVIESLVNDHDIMGICGDGVCCEILREANVGKCDVFIATADEDETNILSCLIARRMKAAHCIARVRNPAYSDQLVFMRDELGLSLMINPEYQAAREISRILNYPSAIDIEVFGRGRIDMVSFKIEAGSILTNVPLKELHLRIKIRVLICAVQREGRIHIPNGDFTLKEGDKIHFSAAHDQLTKFFRLVDSEQGRVKSVVVIGGGTVSYYLAQILTEEMGLHPKIIESNLNRCIELSDSIPKAKIIHADGANHDILCEEGIASADACVTLTGIDEENIILSLFAKSKGVDKVITKVNRTSHETIAADVGLDCIVSTKNVSSDMVLQYVRARRNSQGSNVLTLYRLLDGKVEAIEFIVRQEDARYVNIPISELKLNKNVLIASIIRGKKLIIPSGNDKIMFRDRVVVVSTNQFMNDLNDIFV